MNCGKSDFYGHDEVQQIQEWKNHHWHVINW